MTFENKNILVVSPEPWDHIFVSKHHYAVHLAKRGNKVFFLNPPSGTMGVHTSKYPNISVINYNGFIRGLRYFPKKIRKMFVLREYMRLQTLCNVEFDVVWSFDNSVFYDFDALPAHPLKISHIVDLNQDFQTNTASGTANFCFCTTELIEMRLKKYSQRVFKINHGFCGHTSESNPVVLPGNQDIKALYAGNLGMPYIDWALLKAIVVEHPYVDFVFVGPDPVLVQLGANTPAGRKEMVGLPNVFFTGRVDSGLLQRYYMEADLLLVAYQEKYHREQANPHKMMEYLGSGKIVVSTLTREFESHGDIVAMVTRNDDLPALFKNVSDNLEFYNSPELMSKRIAFANDNSYDKQIDRIEKIIDAATKDKKSA